MPRARKGPGPKRPSAGAMHSQPKARGKGSGATKSKMTGKSTSDGEYKNA